MTSALFESHLPHLERICRGKVRDVYDIDGDHWLIIATDRLSAFDVVLPQPIPGKGEWLTRIANFWFRRTEDIIPNHLIQGNLADVIPDIDQRRAIGERATLVRRLHPLPIEAVVRGYLIGSGWKDYQASGAICGISLPPGLQQADKLNAPIFTPATKAVRGHHDENITFDRTVELIGDQLAERVRDVSLRLYRESAKYAQNRGILIADTKFEFGLDDHGTLYLIDEILTPDSSRFWPLDTYHPGMSPPSFDKQFVRDYLETLDWNKMAPGPQLPQEIIQRTGEKYQEAEQRLTAPSDSLPTRPPVGR